MKQNTIATYEMGRSKPATPTITAICREFRVNEEWLRNGTGDMFLPPPRDALDELIEQHGLPREFRALTDKFLELKPDQREAVIEYMRSVAAAFMAEAAADQRAPIIPPGYSSREELEAEADEFAAIAREQFLSEKKRELQALSAKKSGGPGGVA